MTARSGSTALCNCMEKTGLLGRPQEYFNTRGCFENLLRESHAFEMSGFINFLRSKFASANGIFGFKTNFNDFYPFIKSGVYRQIFTNTKFIFLTREDIVRQAVSLYIASEKDFWHKTQNEFVIGNSHNEKKEVPFDAQNITSNISSLLYEESNWKIFFQVTNIKPFCVTYEDMALDFPGTVINIANYIGINVDNKLVQDTSFIKLSDDLNDLFVKRLYKIWRID